MGHRHAPAAADASLASGAGSALGSAEKWPLPWTMWSTRPSSWLGLGSGLGLRVGKGQVVDEAQLLSLYRAAVVVMVHECLTHVR